MSRFDAFLHATEKYPHALNAAVGMGAGGLAGAAVGPEDHRGQSAALGAMLGGIMPAQWKVLDAMEAGGRLYHPHGSERVLSDRTEHLGLMGAVGALGGGFSGAQMRMHPEEFWPDEYELVPDDKTAADKTALYGRNLTELAESAGLHGLAGAGIGAATGSVNDETGRGAAYGGALGLGTGLGLHQYAKHIAPKAEEAEWNLARRLAQIEREHRATGEHLDHMSAVHKAAIPYPGLLGGGTALFTGDEEKRAAHTRTAAHTMHPALVGLGGGLVGAAAGGLGGAGLANALDADPESAAAGGALLGGAANAYRAYDAYAPMRKAYEQQAKNHAADLAYYSEGSWPDTVLGQRRIQQATEGLQGAKNQAFRHMLPETAYDLYEVGKRLAKRKLGL